MSNQVHLKLHGSAVICAVAGILQVVIQEGGSERLAGAGRRLEHDTVSRS